jgi:DNA-binding LacI/PurR family transcriptional regulator
MAVSLSQVAELASTSVPTVSRVLNGKAQAYAPATIERVQRAAQQLGYRPNWRARSLATQRSNCIGLVYGRPAYYLEGSPLISALVQRLTAIDHDLMLIPAMGSLGDWSHKLSDGRVDGCLITHPVPLDVDRFVVAHKVPAVLINLQSTEDVPQIGFDDVAGAFEATQHLLQLGHRRIVYYATPKQHGEHYSYAARKKGYEAAMASAGIPPRSIIEQPEAIGTAILGGNNPATAMLAYNDFDAARALQQFAALGLSVPRDISLIGFNNDVMAQWMQPPLTSVAPDWDRAAKQALDSLLAVIDDKGNAGFSRWTLPENLVVRKSTAPPK